MTHIQLLHVTASTSRLGGGLSHSVRDLSLGVNETGRFKITVLGIKDEHTDEDVPFWKPVQVETYGVRGPRRFGWAHGMAEGLTRYNCDLVHLHGIWQYPSVAVLHWARRRKRPYIVSTHGMLEPWSLRQSKAKKWLANWLYQRACLREAACLRATSVLEMNSIRQAGYTNDVAMIPNGVTLPVLPEMDKIIATGVKAKRRALFLSRIHPKKGLLNLVKAWAAVNNTEEWELLIVGPDECGHLMEVKAMVCACGLEEKVLFRNEVLGEEKIKCYRESDLFILPSFSENFGLVIAEALSCRVPVITTHPTPWEELETHRCGWWIETGVEPLIAALREAMALSDAERQEMGERGRLLVERRYSWFVIARDMCAVYDWVMGKGPKPRSVSSL